MRKNQPLEGIN